MPWKKCRAIFVLALAVVCGCARRDEPGEFVDVNEHDSSWHAARLAEGDLRLWGTTSLLTCEPYHVWKLIELAPVSVPTLVELLHDDAVTDARYHGTLAWRGGLTPDWQERVATIGDIADYALRVIYETDVGYRSYHTPEERTAAIVRWEQIVEKQGQRQARREKMRGPADEIPLPLLDDDDNEVEAGE